MRNALWMSRCSPFSQSEQITRLRSSYIIKYDIRISRHELGKGEPSTVSQKLAAEEAMALSVSLASVLLLSPSKID